MGFIKTGLKVVGALGVLAIVAGMGGYGWAVGARDARLQATWQVPDVDIPMPWPLSEAEVEALRAEKLAELTAAGTPPAEGTDLLAGVDLAAIAMERAVKRGEHLVLSRYACVECHGRDFGGGTMVDDPMIGTFKGPNLTLGEGSRTLDFDLSDWNRIVRHGVKQDGKGTFMPSDDFILMSDHELSDVVAYIRSFPPVDRTVPAITYGPLGTFLAATHQIPMSAENIKDHTAPHAKEPPPESDTLAFGAHITQPCRGCHGPELAGGPIKGGDPSWAPAANLTPHADGLAGWTQADFENALKGGQSKNGRALVPPMTLILAYGQQMTPVETAAMWTYLQSVPPVPLPK